VETVVNMDSTETFDMALIGYTGAIDVEWASSCRVGVPALETYDTLSRVLVYADAMTILSLSTVCRKLSAVLNADDLWCELLERDYNIRVSHGYTGTKRLYRTQWNVKARKLLDEIKRVRNGGVDTTSPWWLSPITLYLQYVGYQQQRDLHPGRIIDTHADLPMQDDNFGPLTQQLRAAEESLSIMTNLWVVVPFQLSCAFVLGPYLAGTPVPSLWLTPTEDSGGVLRHVICPIALSICAALVRKRYSTTTTHTSSSVSTLHVAAAATAAAVRAYVFYAVFIIWVGWVSVALVSMLLDIVVFAAVAHAVLKKSPFFCSIIAVCALLEYGLGWEIWGTILSWTRWVFLIFAFLGVLKQSWAKLKDAANADEVGAVWVWTLYSVFITPVSGVCGAAFAQSTAAVMTASFLTLVSWVGGAGVSVSTETMVGGTLAALDGTHEEALGSYLMNAFGVVCCATYGFLPAVLQRVVCQVTFVTVPRLLRRRGSSGSAHAKVGLERVVLGE